MDLSRLQMIVDSFSAMSCIVSVERRADDSYGAIRIVTGNPSYIGSIERPAPGTELLSRKFVPNSEYTRYLTRDLNFEDSCYQAAVRKKLMHSYAHPDRLDVWFNMTFTPLSIEEDGLCFCVYSMEIDHEPSTERLTNVDGELAAAVLQTSLKLRNTEDFRAAMHDVIADIRHLCGARFCCILLLNPERRRCTVLCEDYEPDIGATHASVLESPAYYDIASTWADTIAGSNCLIVKNAHDMAVVRERSPRWYETLEGSGVKTIVLFPLESQGERLGYIWATNFDPDRANRIKETLELATFMLSSEIATYLLVDQLRFMSARDMLTGLYNRNAMNRRVERLASGAEGAGKPVAVLYADLNGLKAVNDREGHAAGDRLLQDAAAALRAAFREEEIFRIGGDEFAVIAPGMDGDALLARADALRQAAKRWPRLSFATGCCAVADGARIAEALHLADERMYADKRDYYSRHPKAPGDERR